jgi:hypothetical protein
MGHDIQDLILASDAVSGVSSESEVSRQHKQPSPERRPTAQLPTNDALVALAQAACEERSQGLRRELELAAVNQLLQAQV